MVTLHLGAWTALALAWSGTNGNWKGWTVLDWTCVVIVVGCIQTIAVRLNRIFRALRQKEAAR